jgi:hypothetical protein
MTLRWADFLAVQYSKLQIGNYHVFQQQFYLDLRACQLMMGINRLVSQLPPDGCKQTSHGALHPNGRISELNHIPKFTEITASSSKSGFPWRLVFLLWSG